jgi:Tfp pilus assembly protein PilO
MGEIAMTHWRWHARQWGARLGWRGIAGLALLAGASAVYFGWSDTSRAQVRQLEQEAVSIRAYSRTVTDAANNVAGQSHEAWLEQFYRLLPERASAPEWLRMIFAAAHAQGLGLEQGDYKVTVDRNGRLLSYEIRLPVRGSYVQIRRFVAQVLEEIPAVALDELTTKREAIGQSRVEALVRFTLFLNAS